MVITVCLWIRKCPVLFSVLPLTLAKRFKNRSLTVLPASIYHRVFFLNENAQITEQYLCYFKWSGPLLTPFERSCFYRLCQEFKALSIKVNLFPVWQSLSIYLPFHLLCSFTLNADPGFFWWRLVTRAPLWSRQRPLPPSVSPSTPV